MESNEQLAVKARNGDNQALEQLWTANKPFIITIVKKYTGEPLFPPDFDADGNITGVSPDLMNESFIVMADCVQDYDPDCGYGFLTHLKHRIEWRFLGLIQEQSLVKVPSYMVSLRKKYNRYIDDYFKENGSYPTDIEACEMLQIDRKQLDTIKRVALPLIWLDAPCGDSGDSDGLYELLENSSAADIDDCVTNLYNQELLRVWDSIDRVVTSREGEMLRLRFSKGLKLETIGERYGLTKERVRMIIDNCLVKIRQNGICMREITALGDGETRSYYLGGFGHYKNNRFTSSTEKRAIKNTEKYFERRQRNRIKSEDVTQLEKELMEFFGDVV